MKIGVINIKAIFHGETLFMLDGKKYVCFLFMVFWYFVWSTASATLDDDAYKNTVTKFVGEYCQLELVNDDPEARYKRVRVTLNYKLRLHKLGEELPGWVGINDNYEIYAIKSYKILGVKLINPKNAIATVSYDVVAKRTGWVPYKNARGRIVGEAVFVKHIDPNYIEKLQLIFDSKINQWYVLDPPSPKISMDEIIAFYEADARVLEDVSKINGIPLAQYHSYAQDKRNIALLKSMGADSSRAIYIDPYTNFFKK